MFPFSDESASNDAEVSCFERFRPVRMGASVNGMSEEPSPACFRWLLASRARALAKINENFADPTQRWA